MRRGRVILMHGRSLQALVAARSLAERGVEVIGCDETPLMALSFSIHVQETFLHASTEGTESDFIDDLLAKVKEYRPPADVPYVLMPINDLTYVIARHRERFEPFIRVAAPYRENIDAVMPKHHLVKTARAFGIPIPETTLVSSRDQLEDAIASLSFPIFLKLPDGTGGIGVAKVDSADELRAEYRRFEHAFAIGPRRPVLLQEAVAGRDYCVTALADRGEMRAHMVYRNLRTYPSQNGFGVLRETVSADPLVKISRQLLQSLHWHGVAQLDFRWDEQNPDAGRLIEVNPRFWGGLFHSVASGVDYPWLLYELVTEGKVPEVAPPQIGKRTRVPFLGLLSELMSEGDARHQSEFATALENSWKLMTDGSVGAALQTFASGILRSVDPTERFRRITKFFEENEHAEMELLRSDDPLAPLGLLYILGSLVRTGHLPEEIRRTGSSLWSREGEST